VPWTGFDGILWETNNRMQAMSRVRTPDNIEIASLKKKQVAMFDPMAPGSGTPWEDRGTHGTVGAFFKTCIMSLHSPGELTNQIRRPETINDAFAFLIGCSICWGLSALIHGLLLYSHFSNLPNADFDATHYFVYCVIGMLAAGGATWGLFKLYTTIYSKLVEKEKKQTALPTVLIYNVNVYALGPSLLSIIPFIGPPIALLLIAVDLVAVGSKRLRLRFSAAVVDAILALVVVLVVGVVGYFVGGFVLHQVYDPPSVERDATPHSPGAAS
jgi:hypothetical protein